MKNKIKPLKKQKLHFYGFQKGFLLFYRFYFVFSIARVADYIII